MASSSVFAPAGLKPKKAEAIAAKAVIQGKGIGDQIDAMSKIAQQKFTKTLVTSLQAGEPLGKLAARMSGGTVDGKAVPGFLNITRQQSYALSHTAITAVSKQDRLETFRANADVVSAIQQVSTLDNRTTDICINYSDKLWDVQTLEPIGHSLPWNGGPPRHFNCRSVIVPVVKSPSQLGVKTRNKIPEEVRATMDGQKAASTTFEDWLRQTNPSTQDEVLGIKKAKLFREGKATLKQLIDFSSNPLPMKALAKTSSVGATAAAKNLTAKQAPSLEEFERKFKIGSVSKRAKALGYDTKSQSVAHNALTSVAPQKSARKHVVSNKMLKDLKPITLQEGKVVSGYSGQYDPNSLKITIGALRPDAAGTRLLVHEYGHHVHVSLLKGSASGKIKVPGSIRASAKQLQSAYTAMVNEYKTITKKVLAEDDLFYYSNVLGDSDVRAIERKFKASGKLGGVTSYAHTNELEWFADSWSYYFGNPAQVAHLQKRAPATFKFFEQLLKAYGG